MIFLRKSAGWNNGPIGGYSITYMIKSFSHPSWPVALPPPEVRSLGQAIIVPS